MPMITAEEVLGRVVEIYEIRRTLVVFVESRKATERGLYCRIQRTDPSGSPDGDARDRQPSIHRCDGCCSGRLMGWPEEWRITQARCQSTEGSAGAVSCRRCRVEACYPRSARENYFGFSFLDTDARSCDKGRSKKH